jgi:hypothetical protein
MQGLTNFFTSPGVTALFGVVLGISLKGFFDVFGEHRRLNYEATERRQQRAHEAAMQKEEDRDRRRRAYARFLGTAHAMGQQMRNITEMTREDLVALSESYAETDVVAESEEVRMEAYSIFQSALSGDEKIIDTDLFVAAIRKEAAEEQTKEDNQ